MLNCPLYHRISLTELGLEKGYYFLKGIPTPNRVDYKDYSAKFDRSMGSQARHGYKNVTILWNNLTYMQANKIKDLINQAKSGQDIIYLTINRNNADSPGYDWIDVSGYPHQIDPEEDGDIVGTVIGTAYRNIQLFVNNLTIINDPSTVVT